MIRIIVNNMVDVANNNLHDKNNNNNDSPVVCGYTNEELYNNILNQSNVGVDWFVFEYELKAVRLNPFLNLAARMMTHLNHSFAQCFAEDCGGNINPHYTAAIRVKPVQMENFVKIIKKAENWNKERDHEFTCVSWLTGDENVLQHTTTSGRMEVWVKYNEIIFRLNSPVMRNKPYCTVKFTNALDMTLEIESGIELTVSRLSPIVDILQCLNFSRLNAWKWLQNQGSRKLARAARKGEVDHFNYLLMQRCDNALSAAYNFNNRCQWDSKTFEDAWQYIPDDKRYQKFAMSYFAKHWLNPKNNEFVEPTLEEGEDDYSNLSVLERLEKLMKD
jgi:hypothetical protein